MESLESRFTAVVLPEAYLRECLLRRRAEQSRTSPQSVPDGVLFRSERCITAESYAVNR